MYWVIFDPVDAMIRANANLDCMEIVSYMQD